MLWEELTAADFAAAVKQTAGTCLVPLGIMEKHGEHLPLGTDLFIAREIAARAAALEPAVVFPSWYIGQIFEAKHQPGTLAFGASFMLEALDAACTEIARNGLKKIVLVNGHGGNEHFLRFFIQSTLAKGRDYAVYLTDLFEAMVGVMAKVIELPGGHADEYETSLLLAARPDLVRMERADPASGQAQKRLAHLQGAYTAIWWYADYPHHQAGDPTRATVEKGEAILQAAAQILAGTLKAVKEDKTVGALQAEFMAKADKPV